jgi:hypothetical protein
MNHLCIYGGAVSGYFPSPSMGGPTRGSGRPTAADPLLNPPVCSGALSFFTIVVAKHNEIEIFEIATLRALAGLLIPRVHQ